MPIWKTSLIFNVTTDPANKNQAAAHSGGWSEGFWWIGSGALRADQFLGWAQMRAALLPPEVTITGYRQQAYTLNGNRLLPGGTSLGKFNVPGGYSTNIDLPQAALELSFGLFNVTNTVRQRLTAIPDDCVTNGEYQPTRRFTNALTAYTNYCLGVVPGVLRDGQTVPFGGIIRDLTQPAVRVQSITAAGVLTTNQNLLAVANTSYIIMHRVYDDNGNPYKGSYLVIAVANPAVGVYQYTLQQAPPQSVLKPSGTCRIDVLTQALFISANVGRIVARKIGRPSAGYRGRRSKVRV